MKKLIVFLSFLGLMTISCHAQLLAPKGIRYSLDGLNLTLLTPTATEFNRISGLLSTSTELNLLHGVTATTAEFNYLIGLSSSIQTQLNTKAAIISPTFTGIVKLNTDTLATQAYARAEGGGSGGTWGSIVGTLTDQSDLVTALGLKANIASPTFTGTVGGITSTMVGLGNVTNESKATMFTSPTFTGTVSGVTASMVGLGNVTNESKSTMFTSPLFTGSYARIGTDTLATQAYARTMGGVGGMVYPGAGISVSSGSGWGTSITDNSANWNTAYGWGNHASGGYAAVGQTMYIGTTAVAINRATDPLTLAGITLTTPNIGTPSAGVLTNCTFPTLNQNTTGSAATLTTARTIGGVSFDGSANITVSSATGGFTITGGDLALGANNITMSGSLGVTGTRLTKGWFTNLEISNLPTIGGTGIHVSPTFTGHPTIEGVTSTGATGTGNLVFSISPVFTTPNIGTATGSITGNAATVTGFTPASGSLTLSGADAITVTTTATTSVTLPVSGTLGAVFSDTMSVSAGVLRTKVTTVTREPYIVQIFTSADKDITGAVSDSIGLSGGFYNLYVYSVDALAGAKIKIIY